MTEEEKLQWIDDYLQGKLPEDQEIIFKQQLQTDAQLAKEVELCRDMFIGFERGMDKELKAHFATLEQQVVAEEKQTKAESNKYAPLRKLLPWVVGIAACLLLTLYFFNFNKSGKLYDQYYQPYVIASVERSATTLSNRDQALQAYEEGKYLLASSLLEKEVTAHPQDIDLYFYLGIAYIALEQPQKAIDSLTKVLQSPSSELSRPAHWYLAMAYLKNSQEEKAASHLKTLTSKKGTYYNQALQLLEEL